MLVRNIKLIALALCIPMSLFAQDKDSYRVRGAFHPTTDSCRVDEQMLLGRMFEVAEGQQRVRISPLELTQRTRIWIQPQTDEFKDIAYIELLLVEEEAQLLETGTEAKPLVSHLNFYFKDPEAPQPVDKRSPQETVKEQGLKKVTVRDPSAAAVMDDYIELLKLSRMFNRESVLLNPCSVGICQPGDRFREIPNMTPLANSNVRLNVHFQDTLFPDLDHQRDLSKSLLGHRYSMAKSGRTTQLHQPNQEFCAFLSCAPEGSRAKTIDPEENEKFQEAEQRFRSFVDELADILESAAPKARRSLE